MWYSSLIMYRVKESIKATSWEPFCFHFKANLWLLCPFTYFGTCTQLSFWLCSYKVLLCCKLSSCFPAVTATMSFLQFLPKSFLTTRSLLWSSSLDQYIICLLLWVLLFIIVQYHFILFPETVKRHREHFMVMWCTYHGLFQKKKKKPTLNYIFVIKESLKATSWELFYLWVLLQKVNSKTV